MMTIKRITVKKNERALLLRNGDFDRVLRSGTHWLFTALDKLRVETFALDQPAFRHAMADYLMAHEPEVVAAEFVRVELSTDGGRTWLGTALAGAAEPWAWQLWRAEVLLAAGQHQLVVRAQDDGGHTQPRELLQVWNFKGYMNNAWHRVELAVGA